MDTIIRGSGDVALGVLLGPNESPENLIRRIQQRFSLSQNRIYNNNTMHTQAMIAFDQTFKVANTLRENHVIYCGVWFICVDSGG